MHRDKTSEKRRALIKGLCGLAVYAAVPPGFARADSKAVHLRYLPGTQEALPAIGMGTWITFNTPPYTAARDRRVAVLRAFFGAGGKLVDSSPMYGFAESTIGYCLDKIGGDPQLFSAGKVWTPTRIAGIAQMQASADQWGIGGFDLMQVHNMVDWQTHLETLLDWKREKRVRYIGLTTSHGRRHERMEKAISTRPEIDSVQLTYNIADREAERRLLPAVRDGGKAVIINRPFRRGELFRYVRGKALPGWAAEIDCRNWAQFFLKFIISHPAVTCAIPATSRVDHMHENMGALQGRLPDAAMRRRMINHFESL